jgi:hypothetical protein
MEDSPYIQRLKKNLESSTQNIQDAKAALNSNILDENQMYSKIGEAIQKSPVRERTSVPTYSSPAVNRMPPSPLPENTEVLQVIPVDEKRQLEIRMDPTNPGKFEYVAVTNDMELQHNQFRTKDTPYPPEVPRVMRKDIASLRVDADGHVGFVKSGYRGTKEGAVERLMMEASKRNMTPYSSNLLEPGKKMVSKFKDAYDNTAKEKYLAKIKNFLDTGKTGKIWSAVAPYIGPAGTALTAGAILASPNPAEAAVAEGIDSVIPGGVGELGQNDSEVLRDRKYRSANLIPNAGMLGDYTDAPDTGRYQQKMRQLSNRGM